MHRSSKYHGVHNAGFYKIPAGVIDKLPHIMSTRNLKGQSRRIKSPT